MFRLVVLALAIVACQAAPGYLGGAPLLAGPAVSPLGYAAPLAHGPAFGAAYGSAYGPAYGFGHGAGLGYGAPLAYSGVYGARAPLIGAVGAPYLKSPVLGAYGSHVGLGYGLNSAYLH